MDNETPYIRKRRRGEEEKPADQFLKLRNWLNIIFMVGAIIGVLLYFFHDQTTGTIVVLGAMIFKIVESALRFIR
ncbi:MAG: hypothetical protein KA067_00570 [Prevotella sp.]|nr:hypothetical protein [Prevotella sp.]